jgi:hypothetical protein
MNEQEQWQRSNDAYLAAAVKWVRLRLQQLVELAEPVNVEPIKRAAPMTAAEDTDPQPALLILSQRFGLSHFEQELLLLCAAIELDTGLPAYVQFQEMLVSHIPRLHSQWHSSMSQSGKPFHRKGLYVFGG